MKEKILTELEKQNPEEIIQSEDEGVFLVMSSGRTKRYRVDVNKQTCECEGFKYRWNCRHLKLANSKAEKLRPGDADALNLIPEEGMDAIEFEDLVGEGVYKSLIKQGEIFEQGNWVRRL